MPLRRRPNVRKLARKQRAAALVAALRYRDHVSDTEGRLHDLGAGIRRDAALALGTIAETDGVDVSAALVRSLYDPSSEVRRATAETLASRHDEGAVPALTDAALSWDQPQHASARQAAAAALVSLSGRVGADSFVTTFVHGSQPIEPAREILEQMVAAGGDEAAVGALAAAARALAAEDEMTVERSAEVLVWLGPAGLQPLLTAIDEPSVARVTLIQAIGRLRNVDATEALARLLGDSDVEVRRSAVHALGEIADRRVVPPLAEATNDSDHGVRVAAFEALQQLGPAAVWSDAEAAGSDPRFGGGHGDRARGLEGHQGEAVSGEPPAWWTRYRGSQ